MTIGFDAKRAFFNRSGLGNYSRNVINCLSESFPENDYYLYTPKAEASIPFYQRSNCHIVGPPTLAHRLLHPYWRSSKLGQQLRQDNIALYHGLSNELPLDIKKNKIKSVVTIHDLIFLRYPEFYNAWDRKGYKIKFRFAARNADAVIAISEQTKKDIIEFFNIPQPNIHVVYQTCDPIFYDQLHEDHKAMIRSKYGLSKDYILFVGTIEERKNLLNLVKAIHDQKIDIQLVVVGKETPYTISVKEHIEKNKIKNVWFLKKVPTQDLPALFQMASVFVYPSLFEGFGIPVLEALYSKTPVVTSKGSCFAEAGGPHTLYVDPHSPEEIGDAISKILTDQNLRKTMVEEGYKFAKKFHPEIFAKNLMDVYQSIL